MPRSSIIAGLLGCFASVFGKLALSPESLLVEGARQLCASRMEAVMSPERCGMLAGGTRIAAMGMMLSVNGIFGYYSINALHEEGTTAATVLTTAVNYLSLGLCGCLIFSENVTTRWLLGAILIAVGVYLVSTASEERPKQGKGKKGD